MSACEREYLDPIAKPLICRMFSPLNVKLFRFNIENKNLRITLVECRGGVIYFQEFSHRINAFVVRYIGLQVKSVLIALPGVQLNH